MIYKSSDAFIRQGDRFVYLMDSQNPETLVSDAVRGFMSEIGYSDLYPNFNNLRVGNVHPFAILLSQMVFEKPVSTNLFPSITVGDSSAEESEEVLTDNYEVFIFKGPHIAALEGYRVLKKLFVSDPGWALVQERVKSKGYIIGIKRIYRTTHNIDINIWTENKEVTSFIFDMVCHFVTQKRIDLHREDQIDLGSINGRRSGDINLDFGMLLYGGNVSARASMEHSAVLFDMNANTIDQVNTRELPEYFGIGVS